MYVHLWLCAFLGSFIFFHFVAPRFMFCIFVACGKSTDFCICSCVVYPKAQHVAMVKSGLFLLLLNQTMSSFPHSFIAFHTLPILVSFTENKWTLIAFFEFLVCGAAVSVFHGSEWCGPGSLEFLAARSEALIYQDVLFLRCVHSLGTLDTHTWLHTSVNQRPCRWLGKCQNRGLLCRCLSRM